MKTIGCMLKAVDKSIANKYQESNHSESWHEINEMECLQAEN